MCVYTHNIYMYMYNLHVHVPVHVLDLNKSCLTHVAYPSEIGSERARSAKQLEMPSTCTLYM